MFSVNSYTVLISVGYPHPIGKARLTIDDHFDLNIITEYHILLLFLEEIATKEYQVYDSLCYFILQYIESVELASFGIFGRT